VESKDVKPEYRTICFDLDGVLAQYDGWKGKDHIGNPIEGMRELLENLQSDGWNIIIFTTRGAHETQLWADKYNMPYKWININGDFFGQNMGKPIANIYVDDRAICFDGNPEQLKYQIENFKPYNSED
jgi:hydroxymethylpyrimidine pyrophosphatase-like HAD family hydrolase